MHARAVAPEDVVGEEPRSFRIVGLQVLLVPRPIPVALGCIVKGETDHYDFICKATMDGIMNVALQFGIALGTGLLTCDTLAQAEARSGQDGHNKGAEAAAAALLQINAARRFGAA